MGVRGHELDHCTVNTKIRLSKGRLGIAYQTAEHLVLQAVRREYEPRGYAVFNGYEYLGTGNGAYSKKKFRSADIGGFVDARLEPIIEALLNSAKASPVGWRYAAGQPDIVIVGAERGEFIEVGTDRSAKFHQLNGRFLEFNIAIENAGLGRNYFVPSRWRPCRGVIGSIGGYGICTEPTWRKRAPPGVVLYEVHPMNRPQCRPAPARVPITAGDFVAESERIRRTNPELATEVRMRVPQSRGTMMAVAVIVLAAALIFFLGLPEAIVATLAFAFLDQPGDPVANARSAMRRISAA